MNIEDDEIVLKAMLDLRNQFVSGGFQVFEDYLQRQNIDSDKLSSAEFQQRFSFFMLMNICGLIKYITAHSLAWMDNPLHKKVYLRFVKKKLRGDLGKIDAYIQDNEPRIRCAIESNNQQSQQPLSEKDIH